MAIEHDMTGSTDRGRRRFIAGSAAIISSGVLMRPAYAQAQTLNIGVILPLSGVQAFIGQSCKRGADIAPALLKELGYAANVNIMMADFETSVEVARSRAEKLINDGAHVLVGPFDSGAASAIAQVAEQKGVPFIINIAAAPQITEQGYKFVFRNFFTAPQIIRNGFLLMNDLFAATKTTPKSAVYMHVNDTFGQANKAGVDRIFPALNMPFKIVDSIAYDPAAKDLSVEVAKAKATGADFVIGTTRLNDGILLIREMVKQRWDHMGIVNLGPGMYEQQFYNALGKYSDHCFSHVAWYNPRNDMSTKVTAAFRRQFPNDPLPGHIFNVGFTFEAILIAADAYRRANSTAGRALADALRATRIDSHMMVGGPIQFDEKGQNNGVASVSLQNMGGVPRVVMPSGIAEAAPVFPMKGWNARG